MKKTALVLAALGFALAAPAIAQDYPNKPVRMIVTYPPGGGADTMARTLAPKMGEVLGQPLVVENKGGAGGTIGAAEASRAAPDGYTVMLDAAGFAVAQCLYPKLAYDPAKAFRVVSVVAIFPNMLVANPNFAPKSVPELIAYAKANPGKVSFASSGNGSAQHLAGELFRQKTGVDMVHIPYKGGGPALIDVIGGQVPIFFANMASGLPHVKAGKLRPLAVTGAKRSDQLADTPTVAEAGLAGYEVYEWNAVFVPAATPQKAVDRLSEAVGKAVQSKEFQDRVRSLGGEPVGYGPAESERFIRQQSDLWCGVVKAANVKLE